MMPQHLALGAADGHVAPYNHQQLPGRRSFPLPSSRAFCSHWRLSGYIALTLLKFGRGHEVLVL